MYLGQRKVVFNMQQKRSCILLSDNRPGHYHLSEGVITALKRIYGDIEVERFGLKRRRFMPNRLLRYLANKNILSPKLLLQIGYGIQINQLPNADIVVSAGSNTLIANLALAKCLKAQNIFCGSLRNLDAENFTLVLTSYERYADRPRHVAVLKPSLMDPDVLGRPKVVPTFSSENPPKLLALLVGGDSGTYFYRKDEWYYLFNLMEDLTASWGTKWLVSTSRRTDPYVADSIAQMARVPGIIEEYIDYRLAGPGTLPDIFSRADAVICTEDSSTMISEAISARLPVIGVAPEDHTLPEAEGEYRDLLLAENWTRSAYITDLGVNRLGQLFSEIEPITFNPLDKLAKILQEKLELK